MTLTHGQVATLARDLMNAHGLQHWRFEWDRARRRFGLCSHARQCISLSSVLSVRVDEAEVRDTVLHEIAHALVGPGYGHGPVWRRKAAALGAAPTRCGPATHPLVAGKWQAQCRCRTHHRDKRPRARYRCRRCYTELEWRRV